ncbi:MAG: penicillin-binding transpeptidase domain-containing protein [Saccharofermentanales bacterium]|jgi:stage V sporulation protein D (sporulation-specific penicillin-binding protein)
MKRGNTKNQVKRATANAQRRFNRKLAYVALIFFIVALLVLLQVYNVQIVRHDALAAKAAEQQYMTGAQVPKRGMILDRNGYPLALSTYAYRIGMTPSDIYSWSESVSVKEIVDKMAETLSLSDEKRLTLHETILNDRSKGWRGLKNYMSERRPVTYVQIAAGVKEEVAEQLRVWLNENHVGGVRFDAEEQRVYNNGCLGSQVIGMTRQEDGRLTGVSGLEAQYNELLSGHAGYTYARHNNYGSRGIVPFSETVSRPIKESQHLVTSLDLEVERILREELLSMAAAAGLRTGVQGIVLDVHSGDVLAMEQISSFELDDPAALPLGFTEDAWEALSSEERQAYLSSNLWNNINVIDLYEPGSVFKGVTLAIGLETGSATEDTLFSDETVTVQGVPIRCATQGGHGSETLREGFYRSCNPVFVRLADQIGKETYYDWIHRLGLSGTTGLDLPGEARGIMHANPMPIDFANLCFGESSSFTAIQMARFFAMIGNGGHFVTPRVAIGTTESQVESMMPFDIKINEHMLSNETCASVRSMMEDVVTKGTATNTFGAMGFPMAGKTGTATDIEYVMPSETAEGEQEEPDEIVHLTCSFVCLFPSDQPRYVSLITLRNAETNVSSRLAAQCATRVASRVLNHDGLLQNYSEGELQTLSVATTLENYEGMTIREAAHRLQQLNLNPVVPENAFFLDMPCAVQLPAPGSQVGYGSTVWLYPDNVNEVEWIAVPDFRGRTYHECIYLAAEVGVAILPVGAPQGKATGQSILPMEGSLPSDDGQDPAGAPSGHTESERENIAGRVLRGEVIQVYFGEQ